eukprot:9415629-Prorocentrum_lima.AAC.3
MAVEKDHRLKSTRAAQRRPPFDYVAQSCKNQKEAALPDGDAEEVSATLLSSKKCKRAKALDASPSGVATRTLNFHPNRLLTQR